MCEHLYEYEGVRSYGGNIPYSCQGCYFPGDEPGMRCDLTRNYCNSMSCPFGEEYHEENGIED